MTLSRAVAGSRTKPQPTRWFRGTSPPRRRWASVSPLRAIRRSSIRLRGGWFALLLVFTWGQLAVVSPPAIAVFAGRNGAIAWQYWSQDQNQQNDGIRTSAGTVISCTSAGGSLACGFGRPRYSPDGQLLVVSRTVPYLTPGEMGAGNSGSLEFVNVDGSGARIVPRVTLDDEDPAFLPDGSRVVFAGTTAPTTTPPSDFREQGKKPSELFIVGVNGNGVRQLTHDGGSMPAPCGNGTIAFVKHGDIYLLSRDGRSRRRLTKHGGTEPDCAPNSRRIVFSHYGNLYTISTSGRNVKRVPTHPSPGRFGASYPVFSPSGRMIAYRSGYHASFVSYQDLVVRKLDGQLISDQTQSQSPDYLGPNGNAPASSAGPLDWQRLP